MLNSLRQSPDNLLHETSRDGGLGIRWTCRFALNVVEDRVKLFSMNFANPQSPTPHPYKEVFMESDNDRMTDISHLFDETKGKAVPPRLDAILPADPETGVVTADALEIYLDSILSMTARAGQPVSLISLSLDETSVSRFLGAEGAGLISRAAARCIKQETRPHDVVGKMVSDPGETPVFVIVCPLLSEEAASKLAERLQASMRLNAEANGGAWLTFSIGVTSGSLEITNAHDLIARASSTLLRAKRNGGGRVWRHSDTGKDLCDE